MALTTRGSCRAPQSMSRHLIGLMLLCSEIVCAYQPGLLFRATSRSSIAMNFAKERAELMRDVFVYDSHMEEAVNEAKARAEAAELRADQQTKMADTAQAEVKRLGSEVATQTQVANTAQEEAERLGAKVEHLTSEMTQLQDELGSLRAELSDLKAAKAKHVDEVATLKKELDKAKAKAA